MSIVCVPTGIVQRVSIALHEYRFAGKVALQFMYISHSGAAEDAYSALCSRTDQKISA